MYQIIHRNYSLIESIRNPAIKFFTKKYLEYSIDNVLINNIFLTTIHNYIHWKDARYRYLAQIPHVTAAIIYHMALAFFCSIIVIFTAGNGGLCKQYCINSILQTVMSIVSLYLSVLGSISPRFSMNTTLFYGEKIIEIFERDKDEIVRLCAFSKSFWEAHCIGIQNWMIAANRLPSQDRRGHEREIRAMHEKIQNLSEIKNLFQHTLQLRSE